MKYQTPFDCFWMISQSMHLHPLSCVVFAKCVALAWQDPPSHKTGTSSYQANLLYFLDKYIYSQIIASQARLGVNAQSFQEDNPSHLTPQ